MKIFAHFAAAALTVAALSGVLLVVPGILVPAVSDGTTDAVESPAPDPTAWRSAGLAAVFAPTDLEIAGPASESRNEVDVAIDPTDPDTILVATMAWGHDTLNADPTAEGDLGVRLFRTTDGGDSWEDHGYVPMMAAPDVPGACLPAWAADPVVVFGGDGHAYLSYIAYVCQDDGVNVSQILMITSDDHGATWSTPISVHHPLRPIADGRCGGLDKEWFEVDPTTGDLVMTWIGSIRTCGGPLEGAATFLSRSTDHGQTWSAPTVVSRPGAQWTFSPAIQVGPDGAIHVVYVNSVGLDEVDGHVCPSIAHTANGVQFGDRDVRFLQVESANSFDGGDSWSWSVVAAVCDNSFQAPEYGASIHQTISLPVIASDPGAGELFVAWSDRTFPTPTIRLSSSGDGGLTWTERPSIAETGRGAFLPMLVGTPGAVRMVSMADTPVVGLYDVHYRESFDGGRSWSDPVDLGDAPACRCFSQTSNKPNAIVPMVGHYLGLDAREGVLFPVWPHYDDPQGPHGIHTRPATYGASTT